MNIITISYRSTHYFILDNGRVKLLIDAGWPDTLKEFTYILKRKGIEISDINYVIATHYHPDHAGLVQDIKNAGAKLVVVEEQIPFIGRLKDYIKPGIFFNEIRLDDIIITSVSNSRSFLKTIGFDGELIHTPGHSEDSVSLVLDNGAAFIGDLPPAESAMDNKVIVESWLKLKRVYAKNIYPSHVDRFVLNW